MPAPLAAFAAGLAALLERGASGAETVERGGALPTGCCRATTGFPLRAITSHDSHPQRRYRNVPIVVLDDGEGLVQPAARRLAAFGYTDVALLDGGVTGRAADGASCSAT